MLLVHVPSISDNLLSGLIGGVLGGLLGLLGAVIVVNAEARRERREQRAALRLLSFEVSGTLHSLEMIPTHGAGMTKLLSMSVWEAERVRIASYLRFKLLATVALPYVRLAVILRYREGWNETQFTQWLSSADGSGMVNAARAEFEAAQKVIDPKVMTWRRRFDRWRQGLRF